MNGISRSLLAEFRKVMRAEDAASLLPAGMPRAGLRLGLATGDLAGAFRTVSAGFGQPRVGRSSGAQAGSSSVLESVGSTAVRSVTSGFGGLGLGLVSGFGIGSLISGLAKLFGEGGSAPPPALVRFSLPAAVRAELGISQSSRDRMATVDYSSSGGVRVVDAGSTAASTAVAVVDGQWFLDRSDQIARAVREALLNGNALGDVVGELG